MEDLTFVVKEELDNDLRKDWEELSKRCDLTIFQNKDWLTCWVEEILINKKNSDIFILAIYIGDKLIAILPFELYVKFNFKILKSLGNPFCDYFDFLVDRDFFKLLNDNKNSIFNEVNRQLKPDIIFLENICENSNIIKILDRNNFKQHNYNSYFLRSLNNQTIIPNKIKSDNIRQIKRLNKLGELKFIIEDDIINQKKLLDYFFKQKEIQLNKTHNWNYLKDKNNTRFLEKILIKNKKGHFSVLKLNNKIISMHIGFMENKRFFYIFPVYDSYYSNYSPGNVLLYKIINYFFKNNGEIFDFTTGDERYKVKLSNSKLRMFYFVKTYSLTGILIKYFISLKFYAQKITILKNLFNKILY
ncbi:GNAT family N-acetyltransferase [Candidatus Pelagibacter sp.]|nr:GNAT family N-acetyltransferase [Candidatus Pelagibacter sp.]